MTNLDYYRILMRMTGADLDRHYLPYLIEACGWISQQDGEYYRRTAERIKFNYEFMHRPWIDYRGIGNG